MAIFNYKSVDSSNLWVGGLCLYQILTAGIFCRILFDLLLRSLEKVQEYSPSADL